MTKRSAHSRTTTPPRGPDPARRIRGPAELVQAVPYLLGFHPQRSLVLVGLRGGQLVVTARLDLADAVVREVLHATLRSLCDGGTTEIIAAVHDERSAGKASASAGALPWVPLVADLSELIDELPCELADVLFVEGERYWSYTCNDPQCCPPQGNALPRSPSPFATAATYDGIVPLPDRGSLADSLVPCPDEQRAALEPAVAVAENAAVAAVLDGSAGRHERAVKRALFAAARASTVPRWQPPDDTEAARFAVALAETPVRDGVWMAVDDHRLDGRALWRDLARRVPAPYAAAPLFLFGWASWRAGNSALAGIAAERALEADPRYSAADLLLAALSQCVDPRRMPRLRRPA